MYQLVKNSIAVKALRVAALSLALSFIAGSTEALATGNVFYNFSFIGGAGKTADGQFEVQLGGSGDTNFPDLIVGISGTVSGFTNGSGSFNTLLNSGSYAANDNWFSSTAPYLTSDGV